MTMTPGTRRAGLIGRLGLTVSVVALLAGCSLSPEPFTKAELSAQAQQDQIALTKDVAPIQGKLGLAEAVARAVKYNLDHRVKMMEQAQSLDQLDVSKFDLLPKLTTDAGYDGRSKQEVTTTRDLSTQQNGSYGVSSDRNVITADLTLTWNILDFGVSYYNAKQAADRTLMAEERRRKVLLSLVQDVRSAYWRAASSQRLRADVDKTVAMAEAALADARKSEAENLRNPLEVLRYQRGLVENLRQLETIDQELATAHTELATLIGLTPGTPFQLDVPEGDGLVAPHWNMPIEQMEETALLNNPDLREQSYDARISVAETRKAILRLLPGISFDLSRQYDSNSMDLSHAWNDAGGKIAWNLLNVFSAPATIAAAESGEKVSDARRLALHMAVLSQVHIARRQFDIAIKQFDRASELYSIDSRILANVSNRQANDAQSKLELVSNNTSAIVGLLRRYQTLAQVHGAYSRIQGALGIEPVPEKVAATDLPTLTAAIAQTLDRWQVGETTPAPQPAVPAIVPAAAKPQAALPTSGQQVAAVDKATLVGGPVEFFTQTVPQHLGLR
jgi:outer membrane protein TolC